MSITTVDHLPPSDSPTLSLLHPTKEEQAFIWKLNGEVWRGSLSPEAYARRELHLSNQVLTRNGGITSWVLVDTSKPSSTSTTPRVILASCESYRKRALVAKSGGDLQEVISHGIGSVFTNSKHRGRGYGARMMKELGIKLDRWQQKDGVIATFTVLYSDIGKEFYVQNGWHPFPSSHISLLPTSDTNPSLYPSGVSLLYSRDLPDLCRQDETMLKEELVRKSHAASSPCRLAFVPAHELMQWLHAREKFTAAETLHRDPEVKGAITTDAGGKRIWCIWVRIFGNTQDGNTLFILRLTGEGVPNVSDPQAQWDTEGPPAARHQVSAIGLLLQAACIEAARWGMDDVRIWNPSALVLQAAKEMSPDIAVVDREKDSIASLRWHGPALDDGMEVEWVANDKFAWC